MLPIPAIDIQSGKCVRLQKGDLSSTKIYFEKPIDAAAHWIKEGTKRLHLVDLDGAKSGKPENLEYVLEIKKEFPEVNLQLGGGVRDLETLDLIFESGVDYVILGSIAIKDKELFTKACKTFPEKIILGIDAMNGFLAAEAWTEASKLSASDLINSYRELPIKSIIYTDINKDGMLSGPNLKETSEVAKLSPFPVIASGGVKDINDLTNLSNIPMLSELSAVFRFMKIK
jgi:phosphoribosylformimino-5-aminoimidazole carboxamide ribotide isomerase